MSVGVGGLSPRDAARSGGDCRGVARRDSGELGLDPLLTPGEEAVPRPSLEPRGVPALGELLVLEMRDDSPKIVAGFWAGVRVVVAVEHERRGGDVSECRRIDADLLEANHVGPSLSMRPMIERAAWCGSLDQIESVNLGHESAVLGEADVRRFDRRDAIERGGDLRGRLGSAPFFEDLPRLGTERPATDEQKSGRGGGMFRCESESEHRPPGVAEEDGRRVAVRIDERAEVLDVNGDGEGRVGTSPLVRLESSEATAELGGERREIPRRGGPAVDGDDPPGRRALVFEAKLAHAPSDQRLESDTRARPAMYMS